MSSKQENNAIANVLSKRQIDKFVSQIFETKYLQKKGKKRANKLDHPTPYVVLFGNAYWTNPFAFSTTKVDGEGYPTLPFKLDSDQMEGWAPPSTNKKSTWIPRIPVHCVVWRWANGYAEIPKGMQVSHLTDQPTLISPEYLVLESGAVNRARTACRQELWNLESKYGSKNNVRCPHSPVCSAKLQKPESKYFTDINLDVPGLPQLVSLPNIAWKRRHTA